MKIIKLSSIFAISLFSLSLFAETAYWYKWKNKLNVKWFVNKLHPVTPGFKSVGHIKLLNVNNLLYAVYTIRVNFVFKI